MLSVRPGDAAKRKRCNGAAADSDRRGKGPASSSFFQAVIHAVESFLLPDTPTIGRRSSQPRFPRFLAREVRYQEQLNEIFTLCLIDGCAFRHFARQA